MSGDFAANKVPMKRTGLACPRDNIIMHEKTVGEAQLDVCPKCGGQFFDSGEMFAAFGIKADPSVWDRAETGGSVKDGHLTCCRCDGHMLAQDIDYGGKQVEIDRCGHCGGIFLDKGEVDSIMAISEQLMPVLEAEKAKAAADLAKIPDNAFSPGLIGKFLMMFRK